MIMLLYMHVFSSDQFQIQVICWENNISEPDRQFLSQWAHSGYYIVVWLTNYMHVHTNVVNCNQFYMLVVARLAGFWFYQS